jgi:outer membrane protein
MGINPLCAFQACAILPTQAITPSELAGLSGTEVQARGSGVSSMSKIDAIRLRPAPVSTAALVLLYTSLAVAQQPGAAAGAPASTGPAPSPSADAQPVVGNQPAMAEQTPRPAEDVEAEQGAFDFSRALSRGGAPMSADQAAKLAVEHGPSVESARAAQRKAEQGAAGAWIAVYPKLDLTARYTRLSKVTMGDLSSMFSSLLSGLGMPTGNLPPMTFPQFLNQYALRAALSYPVSDLFFAILPGYRAAKGFSNAAAMSVTSERYKLAEQAREAYYNYARARASRVVALAALGQVEAHRKDVSAMVDAGTLAKVELMRIDAKVAAARVAIARVEAGVAMARTGLEVLTGRQFEQDVAITEPLDQPLPPISESKQQLLKQADQNRPEMLALRAMTEAQQQTVKANSGGKLPHLALAAGVDYDNPHQRVFPQEDKFTASWDISAVLSWSPNSYFDADYRVGGADADLAKIRADMENLEQGLTLEVSQAYEEYNSARAAMEASVSEIAAAEESYRVRREQFRAGAAVATEVLDAEPELRNARLELVNAAIDLRIAKTKLDYATGKKPF